MTPAETLALQAHLVARSIPCTADGVFGAKTWAALLAFLGCGEDRATALGRAMAAELADYGITTRLRVIHFLAQATVETAHWRTLYEYGSADYFKRYDPGTDIGHSLGNTQPGDGFKFRGAGVFQLTGRDNFRRMGKRLGIDLEASPGKAADPDTAVKIAGLYWQDHGLNPYADADDVLAVSRAINRGSVTSTRTPNGLDDRKAVVGKLKGLWV